MFVVLGVQRAIRSCPVILSSVACPAVRLSGFPAVQLSRIFPRYLMNTMTPEKKKKYFKQNVCFDFLCKFCVNHFPFVEDLGEVRLQMHTGRIVMSDCNES